MYILWISSVFLVVFRKWHGIMPAVERAARVAGGGRRPQPRLPRYMLAACSTRASLARSVSLSRSHGAIGIARAALIRPGRLRIMFQCLTNSIGGLGRSIVFSNLHCTTVCIFSVSVTQCVRKKLYRRFWRICVKLWNTPAPVGLRFAQNFLVSVGEYYCIFYRNLRD